MSDRGVPGEGYEFPEWSIPESPPVEQFPQEYDWPCRPSEVHGKKRSIAMERWFSAELELFPDHTQFSDFWDNKRSTESATGRIEVKSPSVYTANKQVGRFSLTTGQYWFSDWIGLVVSGWYEWEVLYFGIYPMAVVEPIVERDWHSINTYSQGWTVSWKSVLREVDRADYSDSQLVKENRSGINDFYS